MLPTVCALILSVEPSAAAQCEAIKDEAKALLRRGEVAEAARLIDEQCPVAQRNADTWFLLADTYDTLMDRAGFLKKRGWAKKMKHALISALESDPKHVGARKELADFYYYAPGIVGGDKDEAAHQLDELERHAPAEAWATRGDFARHAGDLDAAAQHLEKAVALDQRKPKYMFTLAVIEQQRNRFEESIPLLEQVISADSTYEEAYYYRAKASAMAGIDVDRGFECAAQYLDNCNRCDEADRGYGLWRKAALLEHAGQTDAAIGAYREALRYNPKLDAARKQLESLER